MLARAGPGKSAGNHTPAGCDGGWARPSRRRRRRRRTVGSAEPPPPPPPRLRNSSMPKAAVDWPTQSSRSGCTQRSVTFLPAASPFPTQSRESITTPQSLGPQHWVCTTGLPDQRVSSAKKRMCEDNWLVVKRKVGAGSTLRYLKYFSFAVDRQTGRQTEKRAA
eukprot:scaffold13394_cov79-Phaeocystis_antarctica.AAC.4